MKKNHSTILLVLVFLMGLSVLLYPTISNLWNSRAQSKAIADYQQSISALSNEDYSTLFQEADDYNARLREITYPLINYRQLGNYESILDISGTGILGSIQIPKIGVELPIYHTTSEAALNIGAGHLEGTSLPVGGAGTHSVLSAHRGLPSSRLFTDLDRLEEGDRFIITVLNRSLTYEVDRILVVEPENVEALEIKEGEDRCTLVTCTPYAINTHRLLVQGHRVRNEYGDIPVIADARRIEPLRILPLAAAPILILLLAELLNRYRKKVHRGSMRE